MAKRKRNVVYSTDPAWKKRCERCGSYPCRCPRPKSLPPNEQTAYLHRQSKGRGGKSVTIIKQLQLTEKDRKALAKKVKKKIGVGGSIDGEDIIIQGDDRERIAAVLEKMGYSTKIAGG